MSHLLSLAILASLSIAAACASDLSSQDRQASHISATCEPLAAQVSGVVFSDEEGTQVVDMLDNASASELRAVEGIGNKTAQRIIDARPFRSHQEPLAELDGIPYVGPKVLTSLRDSAYAGWCALDDGRQSCCVDVACDAGTSVAGVALTDAESHELLDWANRANLAELDAVCGVGPSLALAITDARPLHRAEHMLDVRRIGNATLFGMLGKEGYGCTNHGTVAEEWCGSAEAQCVCGETTTTETSYVLDEDAGGSMAEETAGVFFFDNSDLIWEEYCQGNYDESAGYDEFAVMNLCEQYLTELYFQAAFDAGVALAGSSYESEDEAFAVIRELMEDVFFAEVGQWALGFPAFVDQQLS